ncbi:MAG TPA: putative Ig domain-containing protein [Chryseosolibacter sp.]
MKKSFFIALFSFACWQISYSQHTSLIFPDSLGWNTVKENEELKFSVSTNRSERARFSMEGGEGSGIQFDSLGNFVWKPSFDFVDRVAKVKELNVIFEAYWKDGKRERQPITFNVLHVNRPPVVEDLPIFYVKLGTSNSYQIAPEYVYDQDGDPLVFRSIQSQMPEGVTLNSQGQFQWTPSRGQFSGLKTNPLFLDFIVQDQPDKAEVRGRLKVAQTQQDLPAELLIVPGDSLVTIKEDETLNLKIYISDPNGDDNVSNAGFVSNDKRIPLTALKGNTQLQYEFTWMPGYDYVDDGQGSITSDVTFFVLDKSANRTQKRVRIKVTDAENLIKKDAHLFQKYRNNLAEAYLLITQLDVNQKKLNQDYKRARKGKKNRSILNASLGAVTGLSPVVIEQPDQSKIVSGVGGTTVLTLGTLEATEVIGRSKESIMDKIKNTIDIRNRAQTAGDEFARKYALKNARRNAEFDKDIEKLRLVLNDQRIVLLELDAYTKNAARVDDKDLKKAFVDFADEPGR